MRALVRTLVPAGPVTGGAARVVAAVQAYLGTAYDPAALLAINERSLAARLTDPWLRQQLVRALVIGLLMDDACARADLARVEAVAAALEVTEPVLVDVAYFIAGSGGACAGASSRGSGRSTTSRRGSPSAAFSAPCCP